MEVNGWPEHRTSKLHQDNLRDPEENPMGYGLIEELKKEVDKSFKCLREEMARRGIK